MRRLLGGLAIFFFLTGCTHSDGALVTALVGRQDVNQIVTASGTVNAQDTVLVGSQVSGTIQEILVDYNSHVRTGQILARLDPSTFSAAVTQAEAALSQSLAQQSVAEANARAARMDERASEAMIRQAESALELARKNAVRDQALVSRGFAAQSVADSDRNAVVSASSAYRNAIAESEATRARAEGATEAVGASSHVVGANRAAAQQAELNLAHATIQSPVTGTVIARNVSVGQTVAAAFQSPTLFTIARDLRKMQVDVAVGEPDVGVVRTGQPVSFTVLAYPGIQFKGSVYQIRQNPTVVQNVTTYDTVVYVDNADGRLRPGMTANASITISRIPGALVVPLAALQWRPSAAIVQRYHLTPRPSASNHSPAPASQWGQTGNAVSSAVVANARGRVFIDRDDSVNVVPLTVLAVNGTTVAVRVRDGSLNPGDAVVTDVSK